MFEEEAMVEEDLRHNSRVFVAKKKILSNILVEIVDENKGPKDAYCNQ